MADATAVPIYGASTAQRPRIAAFGLEAGDCERFQQAFRNAKLPVDLIPLSSLPPGETFDAAILHADGEAAARLAALRAHNRRMILYLVGAMPDIARLSQFGVNAALEALTDAAISRAVEHTYLLLAGKLRRYTRVPLYVPVTIQSGSVSFTAVTEDLSGGGVSVNSVPMSVVGMGKNVTVRISLLGKETLAIPGIVCRISGGHVGVQFERGPEQDRLRKWVDDFLD